MNTPLNTAPPLQRGSMPARRWFGLWRGLAFALWPGLHFAPPAQAPAPWQAAARRRRRLLLLLTGLLAATALAWQWPAQLQALSAGAIAYGLLLVLLFTWVGSGLATALMGAWVLWRGDPQALQLPGPPQPLSRQARTAVIMPICHEDVATVFAGLRATCESVAATGALALFDFYVLSDSSDPAVRAAEQQAWARLREMLGDAPVGEGGRIFYRWRRRRIKRKAGNVADFCRRWGRDYRYMVVLDADSTMSGDTLVQLVRLMEAHPRAGILQTLPQPCGHGTLHARAQQFAHRVTGRLFSLGLAYWQLGDSHYWGHNAILRVAPFMAHCGLAPLPGRGGLAGEILSHDFVEAAMMARAGHEVWLLPQLGGSWEQNPAHLLDELQRDRRWCQGNLQNARLLAEPGWRPVHRVMLGTAAFSYAVAPLWLLFLALGSLAALPPAPGLWALTLTLLLLPRALGVASVLARGEQRAYGGTARLLAGAAAEAGLSALQAPLRLLAHTGFVLGALTGWRLHWTSPSRQAQGVSWQQAWRQLGVVALLVLALLGLALGPALWTSPGGWPLLLPLLLATPLAVGSASPPLGRWAERQGLLWNPEARQPPLALARAADAQGFQGLMPAHRSGSAALAAGLVRPRWMLGSAVLAFAALSLAPRPGHTPELPGWLRAQPGWMLPWVPHMPAVAATAPALRPVALRRPATLRHRPARMIDAAVRARALQAVQQALQAEAAVGPTGAVPDAAL